MNIKQIRDVIAMNLGTLPDYVRAELLSAHWVDADTRRDLPELHGTGTWLVSIPYPGLDYTVDVIISPCVDGSVQVIDNGACVVSGWCGSRVSAFSEPMRPE